MCLSHALPWYQWQKINLLKLNNVIFHLFLRQQWRTKEDLKFYINLTCLFYIQFLLLMTIQFFYVPFLLFKFSFPCPETPRDHLPCQFARYLQFQPVHTRSPQNASYLYANTQYTMTYTRSSFYIWPKPPFDRPYTHLPDDAQRPPTETPNFH